MIAAIYLCKRHVRPRKQRARLAEYVKESTSALDLR